MEKAKDLDNDYEESIGTDVIKSKRNFIHLNKMLSLEKIKYSNDWIDELKKWINKNDLQRETFIVTPKYDGFACKAVYSNGELVDFATRGNGEIGQSIYNKIDKIFQLNLPKKINYINPIEIIGELIYERRNFEFYSQFAKTARSFISSLVSRDEPFDFEIKPANFIAYNTNAKMNRFEKFKLLSELKNQVSEFKIFLPNELDEIKKYYDNLMTNRLQFPYEIDGIVVAVNSFETEQRLGVTNHHPKSSIAIKPEITEGVTEITSIVWETKASGIVMPKANLKPINLLGRNITSATLHNAKFVEENIKHLPCLVSVGFSGEIIPQIIKFF